MKKEIKKDIFFALYLISGVIINIGLLIKFKLDFIDEKNVKIIYDQINVLIIVGSACIAFYFIIIILRMFYTYNTKISKHLRLTFILIENVFIFGMLALSFFFLITNIIKDTSGKIFILTICVIILIIGAFVKIYKDNEIIKKYDNNQEEINQ